MQRHKLASTVAAAAVLVVAVTVGGKVGANAHNNGSFFYWLERDKKGATMITSPDRLGVGTDADGAEIYYSPEEVPQEYRRFVVQPEDLSLLKKFKLHKIVVLEKDIYSKISNEFYNKDTNENVRVGSTNYAQAVTYNRKDYAGYNYLESIGEGEEALEVFFKEDGEKLHYAVCFFSGNVQYYVQGECEMEFLEKLAKEYQSLVTKQ